VQCRPGTTVRFVGGVALTQESYKLSSGSAFLELSATIEVASVTDS